MSVSAINLSDGTSYRLTKREKQWVAASGDIDAALICIRYALVYTRRQPEWFMEVCHPDVTYTSQIVETEHNGSDTVRQILHDRMQANA